MKGKDEEKMFSFNRPWRNKIKVKQWEEKLNNSKRLNGVEEVRQQDLRKANITIFARTKNLREKKKAGKKNQK